MCDMMKDITPEPEVPEFASARVELSRLRRIVAEQRVSLDSPVLTEHRDTAGRRTHVTVAWPSEQSKGCLVTRELIDDLIKLLDEREARWVYFSRKEARDIDYAHDAERLFLSENRAEIEATIRMMKRDGVLDDYSFFKVLPDNNIVTEAATRKVGIND